MNHVLRLQIYTRPFLPLPRRLQRRRIYPPRILPFPVTSHICRPHSLRSPHRQLCRISRLPGRLVPWSVSGDTL